MGSKRLFAVFAGLGLLAVMFCSGCAGPRPVMYNRYNIHLTDQSGARGRLFIKAGYAGWVDTKRHRIVPPNTRLEIGRLASLAHQPHVILTNLDTNEKIWFEYDAGRMGMYYMDYMKMIMSAQPVSLDHLSKLDQRGVREGKVFIGMSKDGVLTALGYPPRHATASLRSNRWIYWRDRHRRMAVVFSQDGKVIQIQ